MEVQYLVGLCCVKRNPDAVDVTVGDMVQDAAAEKERDVDITVTVRDEKNVVQAFKAYEVKKERAPLDVAAVEQLCAKFGDMPAVTHRAMVSASGYSEAAIRKASAHKVDLYEIVPWTRPIKEDFPQMPFMRTPAVSMRFGQRLLCWVPDWQTYYVSRKGPESFEIRGETPIVQQDGNPHTLYATVTDFEAALLLRSTQILVHMQPAVSFGMAVEETIGFAQDGPTAFSTDWPHSHTLDVNGDAIYLRIADRIVQVNEVTVLGRLQWQSKAVPRQYMVLQRVSDQEIFAAAAVASGFTTGEVLGVIFSPDSPSTTVHRIQLTASQQSIIRKLHLLAEE